MARPQDEPFGKYATPIQIARTFAPPGTAVAIRAIAADAEGFLWVATNQGLFRFDGVHFHRFSTEPLTHVAVSSDGWVWEGGAQGLTARQHDRSVKLLSSPVTGLVARGAEVVVSSSQVWRGTAGGLSPTGVVSNGALSVDSRQRVWFGCGLELCNLSPNGAVERWGRAQGVPPETWLGAIAEDSGVVWSWNGPKGLRIRSGQPLVFAPRYGSDMRMEALRDPHGRIWLDGPGLIENGVWKAAALVNPRLFQQSFASDSHGNMWMGSTQGLAMLANRLWVARSGPSEFPAGAESVVRTDSFGLLAATRNGVRVYNARSGNWDELPEQFEGTSARGTLGAANGDVWNLFETRGIIRLNRAGRETGAVFRGNMKGYDFRKLFRDRQGQLWVGAKRGLYQLDERSLRLIPVPLPSKAANPVAFASGPDGQEWMGSEAGIARLEHGEWHVVVPASRLLSYRIRSIAVGQGPVFWVSYRLEAPFSRVSLEGDQWKRRDFTAAEGYGPGETTAMLVDRRGWIWRGTPQGLFINDGVHLGPTDWVHLDPANNLPSNAITPFGLYEDTDASLWVSTSSGVARIDPDPDWFHRSGIPSRLRVTGMRVQGREYLWPEPGKTVPTTSSTTELDFAYWPEPFPRVPTVQYRLLPRQREWQHDADGTSRYRALPAGEYRFEMRSGSGEAVAAYEFRVDAGMLFWWWLPPSLASIAMGLWFYRRLRLKAEYWRAKNAFLSQPHPETDVAERVGEVVLGRYAVQREIGKGGFANVYLAFDSETRMEVAIKILHGIDELEEQQRRRFEKETEALRRIVHPGIVRLLDAGWLSEREPYLVMSYVDGPTLGAILRSGPPARSKAAQWLRQLGQALAETHACGVLHRDLKPENIMIRDFGEAGEQAVVVDFGAAAILHRVEKNSSSLMLGSFPYLAPEQVQGRSSTATDVYSITAVTFEMLTGVRYASLADGTESGLRSALAGFPGEVIGMLASGLSYLPSDRPSDVGRFADQLARALDREHDFLAWGETPTSPTGQA